MTAAMVDEALKTIEKINELNEVIKFCATYRRSSRRLWKLLKVVGITMGFSIGGVELGAATVKHFVRVLEEDREELEILLETL